MYVAPEARSVAGRHDAFVIINLAAGKVGSPHKTGSYKVSSFRIQASKAPIHQIGPEVAKKVKELFVAIANDAMRGVHHRDWHVAQCKTQ